MKRMEHGYSVHTYVYDANKRGCSDVFQQKLKAQIDLTSRVKNGAYT